MKKVCLVTGCAGFIGSHMCDLLIKKKFKVYGVDNLVSGKKSNIVSIIKNKNFIFIKQDIKNIKKVLKKISRLDYVYHFAGHGELIPSIEKPIDYFQNNSLYTATLLDSLKKKKYKLKKFLYAASSSCYGKNNKVTNEKSKILIEHPYAFSKYVGEECVMHWGKVYNIPVISIRIFNAYGPRSRTNNVYGAVIGVFLKQKLKNYPLTIVGNGKQKRDFLYISDVCDAFFKASKSKFKREIFNLGYGKAMSVNYLASLISKKKSFIPWRPGEPFKTEAGTEKIRKKLKWKPKVFLKDGIRMVLKDINNWKNAPLWTKEKISKATKIWIKYLK